MESHSLDQARNEAGAGSRHPGDEDLDALRVRMIAQRLEFTFAGAVVQPGPSEVQSPLRLEGSRTELTARNPVAIFNRRMARRESSLSMKISSFLSESEPVGGPSLNVVG